MPVIDPDNQEFWQACKRRELVLQRCPDCKTFRHPPRPMCHGCNSMKVEWVRSRGRGTVFSYVITVEPVHPALAGKVPFATVVVELDEGVLLTSNVIDCDPYAISIGMPVEVTFEDVAEGITLPKFRRAPSE
ncbi:MAG: OB-fold domain-containing protein [Chloroflexi bacterium]|nr:OB-fold domain-containing protein [Chloroflexota bacterium]